MFRSVATAAALFLAVSMPGGAWAAPASSPWGEGYFPNVPLVTHEGKTVRFYDDLMKDKLVLINFVFATCDQSCPLDTAKMRELQKALGDRVGRDIFMYSITLDPEHDTPAVLKAYAKEYGVGPGWLFLTGKRKDIDKVRDKLGDRGAKEQHANSVRVGNVAKGQWMRLPLSGGRDFLVVEIDRALHLNMFAGIERKSIADAPRHEAPIVGQVLFANRCAACHAFGDGEARGPDLKGITERRERAWVRRYLAEPNKMRAGKDAIALELAKNWKVLMPNLGLTTKEVDDLLAYMEAHSQTPSAPKAPLAAAAAAEDAANPAAHDHHAHDHHAHHHHGGEKK